MSIDSDSKGKWLLAMTSKSLLVIGWLILVENGKCLIKSLI